MDILILAIIGLILSIKINLDTIAKPKKSTWKLSQYQKGYWKAKVKTLTKRMRENNPKPLKYSRLGK